MRWKNVFPSRRRVPGELRLYGGVICLITGFMISSALILPKNINLGWDVKLIKQARDNSTGLTDEDNKLIYDSNYREAELRKHLSDKAVLSNEYWELIELDRKMRRVRIFLHGFGLFASAVAVLTMLSTEWVDVRWKGLIRRRVVRIALVLLATGIGALAIYLVGLWTPSRVFWRAFSAEAGTLYGAVAIVVCSLAGWAQFREAERFREGLEEPHSAGMGE